MAQLIRKRLILAGVESSYNASGTTLTATHAVEVSEPEITPIEANDVERSNTRTYLGAYAKQLAGKRVTCSFKCELRGSGTAGAAPNYGVLLKACGMKETLASGKTATYVPVSESFGSAALWFYNDGTLHKLSGARGTFKIESEADGIAYLSFDFTGLFNTIAAGSAPTPNYGSPPDPVLADAGSTSFSVHQHNATLSKLAVDMGNSVDYIAFQTKQEVMITDRKVSGAVTIQSPALSTQDYFKNATDHKLDALSYVLGKKAGNIVEITAPKVQIDKPSYGDISGVVSLEMPLIFTPNSGNDELQIVVK